MIYVIRSGPEHTELVVRHRVEMLRTMGWDDMSLELTAGFVRDYLKKDRENAPICYLAHNSRHVVGGCALGLMHTLPTSRSPNGLDAYLHNMFVEPHWRGRGIASFLLSHVLEEFRSMGIDKVTLRAADPESTLYERQGFLRRPNYYVHHLAYGSSYDCT
jgi:ribosomal protein S18 acetylase RimI-like enzyme